MKKEAVIHLPVSEDDLSNIQRLFVVGGQPFFALGGQVHNSSAYNARALEAGWNALRLLHANTAEVPVYWEQVEPSEGVFDFSAVDAVLAGAREHGLKLILLWYATWKNGMMKYAPAWVKSAPDRFKRVRLATGEGLTVLSPHCAATLEADRRAFSALLEHLRLADGNSPQPAVIAVQVENEPGMLGSDRDYGPEAELAFHGPVPADLVDILQLAPRSALYGFWHAAGQKKQGAWPEMFGPAAAELFSAWHTAQFIDAVAAGGKAAYALPMYVNAWLGDYTWRAPGLTYPAGGPARNVLDIWRWAAPHIDLVAPDNYHRNPQHYCQACADYTRRDNTLFIPESGLDQSNARNLFYALADYNAIGYAVFGVESLLADDGQPRPEAQPLIQSFHAVAAALPLILRYQGTGQIHAVVQEENQLEQYLDLGETMGLAVFSPDRPDVFRDYHHPAPPPGERGRGLVFQAGPAEFYLVGSNYRLLTKKKKSAAQPFWPAWQAAEYYWGRLSNYQRVEEGHFDAAGHWVVDRQRNGDESDHGLWVAADTGVTHAVLSD
jgi:beta-galactosidase GanA